MIIKELTIRNFRSYYGENHIELSEGLTLLVGGNGDGKTTFFESIEWLFGNSLLEAKDSCISEKRKSELEIGESDIVSVSMLFEHNGLKELEKSFTFERTGKDSIKIRDSKFVGYETRGAERRTVDGEKMLDICFEPVIRKYCLFKGESELNVFEDPTALETLVRNFSNVKQFDKLVELLSNFELKSLSAANKELRNDKKVSSQAKILTAQMDDVKHRIKELQGDLKKEEQAVSDYTLKLDNLEKYQEASEVYQTIKERLKVLQDKRIRLRVQTDCDYNIKLLDDYWILRSFYPILKEFQKKVGKLSREKRKLNKEYVEQRALAQGEQNAINKIQKLANGATPLPWNLPDVETMQEMIDAHVCKVCNTPAPVGSDAYNFMVQKLNEYLEHVKVETGHNNDDLEEKPLFPNSYINELHTRQIHMSGEVEQDIARLETDIKDDIEFVQSRKKELEKVEKDILEGEDAKTRLLLNSPGLSEELLEKSFSDLKGFFDSKGRAEQRVLEYKLELEKAESERKEIQHAINELQPSSTMTQVYQRVHLTLDQILRAFKNAKEKNVSTFLEMLENEANHYLKILNENDFYGIIKIRKTVTDSAKIELYSENGGRINDPNGALKTTMYMSVLFAISSITTLKREQDYPLIFDAPTSSFEDYKEDIFYNVIDKIDKQCIIATKDLLITDKKTGTKTIDMATVNKLSCTVYRISKAPNFNEKDLSTIQTNFEKIK